MVSKPIDGLAGLARKLADEAKHAIENKLPVIPLLLHLLRESKLPELIAAGQAGPHEESPSFDIAANKYRCEPWCTGCRWDAALAAFLAATLGKQSESEK